MQNQHSLPIILIGALNIIRAFSYYIPYYHNHYSVLILKAHVYLMLSTCPSFDVCPVIFGQLKLFSSPVVDSRPEASVTSSGKVLEMQFQVRGAPGWVGTSYRCFGKPSSILMHTKVLEPSLQQKGLLRTIFQSSFIS